MKNVLIPTDFSLTSISLIKDVIERLGNEKVSIVLLHGYSLTDSITDLLFFSKAKVIESLSTKEFTDSLLILKNHFSSRIHKIEIDIYTGFTRNAFKNKVNTYQVTDAFIYSNYKPIQASRNSFDITPNILKSSNLEKHLLAFNSDEDSNYNVYPFIV